MGIVADIATVTAMTKATALNAQTSKAAGANVPGSPQGLFSVLLQLLAQPATGANQAGQPDAQAVSQSEPQPFQQVPQDVSNAIALLQSAAPQQSQTAKPQSGSAEKNNPEATADAVSQAALEQLADAAPGAATAPDAQPATQSVPQNDAKQAAENGQPKAADANSIADPKTAPDANLVAASAQQMQAAAVQPQVAQIQTSVIPSPDNATAAGSAPVSPDAKPAPVHPQMPSGKGATAVSNKATFADAKQTGTDSNGAVMNDTSNIGAPKADAKGNGEASRPVNTLDVAMAQNTQSSAPIQSANTSAPSVTAPAVQAQVQTAIVASLNVNLQIAPQHQDATSTLDLLGVTIAAKSADGIKHFDISLDPPELGRIQVHLSLDDFGKAQASLVVDKPQTLELLQRDAAGLTRSLNDAGVSLSNNGLNFSLRGQDRQNEGGGVVKGRSRELSVKAVIGTDAISNSNYIASLAPDSVRLDIRV